MQQITANPLAKHFRQPKIYISLPSNGMFYKTTSLERIEENQYPVLAMTAKDELALKTPDALLNGQATVNVIQSCMPNIKDAWDVPSIDLDAILIAIRIATYGETMDIKVQVPVIDDERSYEYNLVHALDDLSSNEFENLVVYDNWKFEIKPMTYREFTSSALKTFEERRLFNLINNDDMPEDEKLAKFNESFDRLTDININSLLSSVVAVQYGDDDVVSDNQHISEFFNNADKDLYKKILEHIQEQKEKFQIKDMEVALSQEDISAGAPETLKVPISFDQADFFG